MEPQAVAEIARGLATALENPQLTDSDRLSSLGNALEALAAKMEPQAAAEIAKRGAQRLVAALENPQLTDSDRLSSLGNALEALAAKMEPQAAAEIAKRGAQRLVAALPKESAVNGFRPAFEPWQCFGRHWRLKWNRRLRRRSQNEVPSAL